MLATAATAALCASSCAFIRINGEAFDIEAREILTVSGPLTTKTVDLPQFSAIESNVSADIEYSMTDGTPSLTISAPESIIDRYTFEVVDGILWIRLDGKLRSGSEKIRINIQSATLSSLHIRGAGDFRVKRGIDCPSLEIVLDGAGDIEMDGVRCEGDFSVVLNGAGDVNVTGLSCKEATVSVNGAGDADLEGEAESATLSIRGAGDIDASRLKTENVSTSVAGVGKIKTPAQAR